MGDFLTAYKGYFRNMLAWDDLTALWQAVRDANQGQWYVYAVGEPLPESPADADRLNAFLEELDALLRSEHEEDYCGIVYADNPATPSLIKVYDPHNLGSVCGSGSAPPPLPGWILSTLPPQDLEAAFPPPNNRRRWWQRVFGG